MKRISKITRITLLLAVFFGLDKGLGILRYLFIGREFGLSQELDVFNAANNMPDFLFALISGGALAIAFIPVLSEVLSKEGQNASWKLFSNILNLAFLLTGIIAIVLFIFTKPIVSSQIGIAPGFSESQQALTTSLMRLNLIATLIFSISGLVMAGLQANQHFLFPALAPIFYDLGQIFGVIILAPNEGFTIGPIRLPAYGLGVKGLVYGVILGAILHLMIQVPGLIKFHFKWHPIIKLKDPSVRKVISLMGPRILSVIAFNLIFLVQDNLASRLQVGSISALTYGWLIMQVPETLIGTAIATALLPTLSELIAKEKIEAYKQKISSAIRILIMLTLPIAAVLGLGLFPMIRMVFSSFTFDESLAVFLTSQAFLIGLTGHSLVELGTRSSYARQNAKIPAIGSFFSLFLFIPVALIFLKFWGAAGIALANSIAYIAQAVFLLFVQKAYLAEKKKIWIVLGKSFLSSILGGFLVWFLQNQVKINIPNIILVPMTMAISLIIAYLILFKQFKTEKQL